MQALKQSIEVLTQDLDHYKKRQQALAQQLLSERDEACFGMLRWYQRSGYPGPMPAFHLYLQSTVCTGFRAEQERVT